MLQAMDPNAKVDTTRFEIETDALGDLLIKAFGMLPEPLALRPRNDLI